MQIDPQPRCPRAREVLAAAGTELKLLDPEPVETIRIDAPHRIIEIAPAVRLSALPLR